MDTVFGMDSIKIFNKMINRALICHYVICVAQMCSYRPEMEMLVKRFCTV